MQYRLVAILAVCGGAAIAQSSAPAPTEADYVLKNFSFTSGESLPELKIHYRTLGKPQRDAQGVVRNAVLISHGTGGAGTQFLQPQFAGELFAPGSHSTPAATTASLPTESAMGNPPNRAPGSTHASRITATPTWSKRNTGC